MQTDEQVYGDNVPNVVVELQTKLQRTRQELSCKDKEIHNLRQALKDRMPLWAEAKTVKPVTGEDCIVLIEQESGWPIPLPFSVYPLFVHWSPGDQKWWDLNYKEVEDVVAWIRPENLAEEWIRQVAEDDKC